MKFLAKLRPRTLRILFTIAALAVLTAALLNFAEVMVYRVTSNDQCRWIAVPERPDILVIVDVQPGGVTERAGIVDGDTLLKMGGKTFTFAGSQALLDSYRSGDVVSYTIKRGERVFDAQVEIVKLFNIPFMAFFTLGMGFLFVGYVVFMTKPEGSVQRKFGRFGLAAMLLFGFYGLRQNIPGDPILAMILFIALVAGYLFSIPQFVGFFLHFPVRRKAAGKRWIVPALYGVALVNIALFPLAQALKWPQSAILAFVATPYIAFLAGVGIFCHSYFRLVPPERKASLRPILVGLLVGGATMAYIIGLTLTNPFALFFTPWLSIPGPMVLVIPVTFGYSIFRYRLMDIDLIVKRSLIYGSVTAAIAAIYFVIVYGVGSLIAYFLGTEENRLLNVVAFILIALAFDPIKRRTQSWIDRSFYRERLNYQRALLEFSQELRTQMNLAQIMDSIVHRISATMHVETVAVVVRDEAGGAIASAKGADASALASPHLESGLLRTLERHRRPIALTFLGDEGEISPLTSEEKEVLRDAGVLLAVPMIIQDRLVGAILAGEKKSGRMYSQDDTDLLSTVAGQAAIAIENARLHTSEVERRRMEEELSMARRIQEGLFPRTSPAMDGIELSGASRPATSVGGDYFDYIPLGPERLLVVVADVSGKGMSAALYMSKIQGMIQLAAHMYSSPREMLVHVNRRLYDGIERNSFITMVLALFDLRNKEAVFCRAGHNRPIGAFNGTTAFIGSRGIGLGLERGTVFDEQLEELRVPLVPGSAFLLYSDGLTEARDPQGREYGEEPLRSLFEGCRGQSAAAIQKTILDSVTAFQGGAEQHDDITLLTVKYR